MISNRNAAPAAPLCQYKLHPWDYASVPARLLLKCSRSWRPCPGVMQKQNYAAGSVPLHSVDVQDIPGAVVPASRLTNDAGGAPRSGGELHNLTRVLRCAASLVTLSPVLPASCLGWEQTCWENRVLTIRESSAYTQPGFFSSPSPSCGQEKAWKGCPPSETP